MNDFENEQIENIKNEILEYKILRPEQSWDFILSKIHVISDAALEFKENLPKDDYQVLMKNIVNNVQTDYNRREYTRGISARHEKWFSFDNLYNPKYWEYYKRMMEDWPRDRFINNQNQTIEIINHLANPRKNDTSPEDATRKGLVYGHVQSGKTAQMASLIAMYASCGCKLVIVFSGITNSLREQTQTRFKRDLGIDKFGGWDLITTKETDKLGRSDVCIEGKLYNDNNPVLGVFKKNTFVLKRLLEYLKNTNNENFWNDKQVLVIDDECDNASMNMADIYDKRTNEPTGKHSTINGLITQILNVFKKYCYIGFTATPFANVLNEEPGKNSLYPKDFIYPLEISEKYYSARKLFGTFNDDPDNPRPILDVVNYVDEEELSPKHNDYNYVPESLEEAVYYFICATACKYYRKKDNEHSSMLVHVDLRTGIHHQVNSALEIFIEKIKTDPNRFMAKLELIWDEQKNKIDFDDIKDLFSCQENERKKYSKPNFDELKDYIFLVLKKLQTVVDNSTVEWAERLHYADVEHGEESNVFIVIGGNTLSRGLTLEGLIVSYFYRTTKLYDTLLQMGRWFGYRIGFEDLPRIWTTHQIADKFSLLADIEDELQEQFTQYEMDVTPCDIAPQIRVLPLLQITRKKAMQSAKISGINFSGQRPSTLFFEIKNKTWLMHNIQVTKDFLNSIDIAPVLINGQQVFENVKAEKIRKFINNYNICESNNACRKDLLLKYLDNALQNGYLQNWNVAVISNIEGRSFQISDNLSVRLSNRSQIDPKDPLNEIANIKTLARPFHMLVDTNYMKDYEQTPIIQEMWEKRRQFFDQKGIPEPGLLLIYPIDKNSVPRDRGSGRLPLDAVEDIIGVQFVFPKDKKIEFNQYMAIPLEGVEYDNEF